MSDFKPYSFFNELSLDCNVKEINPVEIFRIYAESIKALKEEGFAGVRYEFGFSSLQTENLNIFELADNPKTKTLFAFIQATARNPYIDPDDKSTTVASTKSHETNVVGTWLDGLGFEAAYLSNGVGISLQTHDNWKNPLFEIRNKKDFQKVGNVLNVFSPDSVKSDLIKQYIENNRPILLKECEIQPEKKDYKFRDDHGIDKLISCWKKIRNSNYVIKAINSLPFNPNGVDFIEKCFDDGKIHIRLIDSDAGYGMVVQTTGRNLRETNKIGQLLCEKFR